MSPRISISRLILGSSGAFAPVLPLSCCQILSEYHEGHIAQLRFDPSCHPSEDDQDAQLTRLVSILSILIILGQSPAPAMTRFLGLNL